MQKSVKFWPENIFRRYYSTIIRTVNFKCCRVDKSSISRDSGSVMKGSSIPPKSFLSQLKNQRCHTQSSIASVPTVERRRLPRDLAPGGKTRRCVPGAFCWPRCRRQGTAGDSLWDLQESFSSTQHPAKDQEKGGPTKEPITLLSPMEKPLSPPSRPNEAANPTQSTLVTRSSHPVTHQWSVRQLERQADRQRPPGRTRGAATALLANGQCCSFSLGPRMPPRKEHLQGGAKSWASSPPQQQWDVLRRQSEQS